MLYTSEYAKKSPYQKRRGFFDVVKGGIMATMLQPDRKLEFRSAGEMQIFLGHKLCAPNEGPNFLTVPIELVQAPRCQPRAELQDLAVSSLAARESRARDPLAISTRFRPAAFAR